MRRVTVLVVGIALTFGALVSGSAAADATGDTSAQLTFAGQGGGHPADAGHSCWPSDTGESSPCATTDHHVTWWGYGNFSIPCGFSFGFDWGDGAHTTTSKTLSGSGPFSLGTHDFADPGDYVVAITVAVLSGPCVAGPGAQQVTIATSPDDDTLAGGGSPDVLPTSCSCNQPVNTATGEFWHTFNDLSIPGRGVPLDFTRTYSSVAASSSGPLGHGWTHSYNVSLTFDGPGNATLHEPNSSAVTAKKAGSDYTFPSYVLATLEASGGGTFTFTRRDQSRKVFSAAGRLIQEIDRNGYVTTLAYNGSQRLASVTDPGGRALTFAYNGSGLITSVSDTGGRSVTFAYDGNANLINATDVLGHNWSFTYSGAHRLLTMTNPRGGVTTNTYDASGRVTSQTDAMNRKTTFAYSNPASSRDQVTTITDPRGGTTVQVYTDNELVNSTSGVGTPHPALWLYTYDPAVLGRTVVTDPKGGETHSTFDAAGNVLTTTDPLGRFTAYTYNEFNEPLTVTDPLGTTTTRTYDEKGNLLSSSTPLEGTADVATTTYTYGDGAHPGDVTAITDPEGHTTHYTYDAAGNRLSTTDPNGHATTATYDTLGRVTTAKTGTNHTSAYTHNAFGDLLTLTDPLAHVTTNVYDANRNLTSSTDASAHTTTYTYDADDERTSTTRPNGAKTTSTYDGNGNITSAKDANGHVTTHTYDALNRQLTTKDPLGRTTTNVYDTAGNRTKMTDAAGRNTTFAYNADRELTAVSYSDGQTPGVLYAYDGKGRRVSMQDGTGTTAYTYDSLGRLTGVTNGAGQTVLHDYDLAGHATTITYPNGHAATNGYDAAGNLVSVEDWLGNTTHFTYDANDDLTSQTVGSSPAVTDTYSYDGADRLSSIADVANATTLQNFTYTRTPTDLVASRVSSGIPATTFAYDTNSRLSHDAAGAYTYDNAGNSTNLTGTAQTFDTADQLATNGTGSNVVTFGYGATGNRTSRTTYAGTTTEYRYDQADHLTAIAAHPALPKISAISPKTGPSVGGTTVTITGTGFNAVTSVQFGSHVAHFTVVSDQKLTAQAPTGAGTVNIRLTRPSGTSAVVTAGRYSYAGGPTITSVTPSAAKGVSHPSITVTGTGFTGVTAVRFGSVNASSFSVVSSSKLTARAPSGHGTVDVRVATTTGTSPAVAEDAFAYDRIAPTVHHLNAISGPANATTSLTIVGTGFGTAKSVHLGAQAAVSFTVRSDHVLTAVAPTGTGTVAVSVTNVAGSSSANAAAKFIYLPAETSIASYVYDGDGLRMRSTVGATVTPFAWDTAGPMPLALSDGTNSYLYGPGGLPIEHIADDSSDVTYYHHDHLGSTTLLTSATGDVVTSYTYSSYGALLSGAADATPFLYGGQYRDAESGLYSLPVRFYDPTTAQFLTVDPLVAATQSPYGYADADPVNKIDRWGAAPAQTPAPGASPPSFFSRKVHEYFEDCKAKPFETLAGWATTLLGIESKVAEFVVEAAGKAADYLTDAKDRLLVTWNNIKLSFGSTDKAQYIMQDNDPDLAPRH